MWSQSNDGNALSINIGVQASHGYQSGRKHINLDKVCEHNEMIVVMITAKFFFWPSSLPKNFGRPAPFGTDVDRSAPVQNYAQAHQYAPFGTDGTSSL